MMTRLPKASTRASSSAQPRVTFVLEWLDLKSLGFPQSEESSERDNGEWYGTWI